MKSEESTKGFSISTRPTHGTAQMVSFPTILPTDKRQQEVFLVQALMTKLEEFSTNTVRTLTNVDDSDGNHDVMLEIDEHSYGIQVTELTYELKRKRANIRQHYLEKLLLVLKKRHVQLQTKMAASIKFHPDYLDQLDLAKPDHLINTILSNIDGISDRKILPFKYGNIYIEPVTEGELYLPMYGNLGIDVNFDLLPRSLDTYTSAIDYLAKKKANSKSPWLLIWSLEFWLDKHWLGDTVIAYMQNTFRNTEFERVYFLETLDGAGIFQANLACYCIKG